MNIFLFIDKYLPNPLSCANLMFDLSFEIEKMGHKSFVFTMDNTIKGNSIIKKEHGITVIRTSGFNNKNSNKFLRAYAEMTMSNKILKHNKDLINNTKCDLIIVYSPSIFWSKVIKSIKNINQCKSYLILRDLFPQWLIDTGVIKKGGIIEKFFSYEERKLYNLFEIIGVQSPSNLSYFNKPSLKDRYNLEVLYNWTRVNNNEGSQKKINLKKKLGLVDKTIFIYAGNIGFLQDIMNIVRLAENLQYYENVHFIIIGDGTEKENIDLAINEKKLKNIILLNPVSEEELIDILRECDVGIISLSKQLKTENIPGKLLSYCRAGIPILASINKTKDLRNMIVNSKCGFVIENGDDEEFKSCAVKLHENRKMKDEYGLNTSFLLEKYFDVKSTVKQILTHYE